MTTYKYPGTGRAYTAVHSHLSSRPQFLTVSTKLNSKLHNLLGLTPTIEIMCLSNNSTSPTAAKANTMNKKCRVTFAPEISKVIGTFFSGTLSTFATTSAPTVNKMSKKSRVTFAPEISKVVGTVISREDYTIEEKKNSWWSAKEQASKSHSTHSIQPLILSIQPLILTVREHGQQNQYLQFQWS
jgi:hypothetical protein